MKTFEHGGVRNDKYLSEPLCKSVVFEPRDYSLGTVTKISDPNRWEDHFSAVCDNPPLRHAIGFYFIRDATLRGSGFIIQDGRIIDASDIMPSYVRDQIGRQDRWDLVGTRQDPIETDGPVLLLCGDSHLIYGHWLIDILPRAWLYSQCFGQTIAGTKLAIPVDTPKYAIGILTRYFGFDADTIVYYNVSTQDIKAKHLIVPSLMHVDHSFHPAMNLFVSYLVSRAERFSLHKPVETQKKIFVSRREFRDRSSSYRREIANEDAVTDLLDEYGFTRIFPEKLRWEEQILTFAAADVIVGEAGSGLHNTIFSDFGSRVICLNPANQVQGTIAGLRQQNILYLKSDDANDGSETVDLRKLREACEIFR